MPYIISDLPLHLLAIPTHYYQNYIFCCNVIVSPSFLRRTDQKDVACSVSQSVFYRMPCKSDGGVKTVKSGVLTRWSFNK